MNISFSVAYNERRLRRVITFLVRRQLKWLHVMGVVAAVAGVAALATEFLSDSTGTFFIAMGLILAVLLEPFSVAQSMRM